MALCHPFAAPWLPSFERDDLAGPVGGLQLFDFIGAQFDIHGCHRIIKLRHFGGADDGGGHRLF